MSESIGKNTTSEWYTPIEVFVKMDEMFDLDPCCPMKDVPSKSYCKSYFTENGLGLNWRGFIFMNPPWSGTGNKKRAIVPWLDRFIENGNGVCIFPARTSCDWFIKYSHKMDAILFPNGKTKFLNENMEIQKQPMQAVCFGAIGKRGVDAISRLDGVIVKELNRTKIQR